MISSSLLLVFFNRKPYGLQQNAESTFLRNQCCLQDFFEKFLFKAIADDLAKLRWPPVFKFVCIAVHFPYFVLL